MKAVPRRYLARATMVVVTSMLVCSNNLPAQSDPTPPKNAIVLFDGKDLSQWTDQSGNPPHWKLVDGAVEAVSRKRSDFKGPMPRPRGIMTKKTFQDCRLHVEFRIPEEGGSNGGVYLQHRYEIQILDSVGQKPSSSMGGAIYRHKPPDKNVCKKRGEWQTYDITFRAARYEGEGKSAKKVEKARMSVVYNGVPVHDDVEVPGTTGNGKPEGPEPGPILLQEHGAPVQFRNVWIVPLDGTRK